MRKKTVHVIKGNVCSVAHNIANVQWRLFAAWSGLQQHIIDEVMDHVAWTAARLCENCWMIL